MRTYKKRVRKNKSRTFRGMPVQEARASLHVQPNKSDIAGATKEDPTNCAYARCIRRTMESPNVWVFKGVAYIQTLDEQGKPIIERYLVKKYAREFIVKFDHGERVEPGGFVFHAPSRYNTLAYKSKQEEDRRHRGKKAPRTGKGPRKQVSEFSLRRGTGRVHLFGSEDQIR